MSERTDLETLKRLAARHYELSREIRGCQPPKEVCDHFNELVFSGLAENPRGLPKQDPITGHCYTSCIEYVFGLCRQMNRDEPDFFSFEEVWENEVFEGHVCEVCIQTRKLKAARAQASRKRGAVRAALTRMGERFAREAT